MGRRVSVSYQQRVATPVRQRCTYPAGPPITAAAAALHLLGLAQPTVVEPSCTTPPLRSNAGTSLSTVAPPMGSLANTPHGLGTPAISAGGVPVRVSEEYQGLAARRFSQSPMTRSP